MNEDNYIDKDLEDIRYYRGSIQQFKDFWERKMKVDFNPHGTVDYKYPEKRTEIDNSTPYQDFVNGTSSLVKHNLKTRKKGIKENQITQVMESFIESYDNFRSNIKVEEDLVKSSHNEKIKSMGEAAKKAREMSEVAKAKYETLVKEGDNELSNIELLKYSKFKAESAMLSAEVELMSRNIKTNESVLNEISYDEQEGPPESSFRSEDYMYKDELRQSLFTIEELLNVITDGEQLDDEQSDIIHSVYNSLQKLKRLIHGREELKKEDEEKRQDEQSFGN